MSVERDIRFDLIARLCPNTTGAELRSVATEVRSQVPIHRGDSSYNFKGWYVRNSCAAESRNGARFLGRGRKGCKTRYKVLVNVR